MAYSWKRGGVFWIGYTDSTGKRWQKPTKAETKTKALDMARELERNADRAEKGLKPEMAKDTLFGVRAIQWLKQLPRDYRSKDTAETYLRQRILPFLKDIPCRAMGRPDVNAMLRANEADREGKDSIGRPIILEAASLGTLDKLRGYVHTIYEWLIDDLEVVDGRNPAGGDKMRASTKPPKRIVRHIPIDELVRLLKEVPEFYRLLYVFSIVSGVRRGELIPLTWNDVNLEERKVYITKSRGYDTTKTKAERFVVIPQWLAPIFQAERDRKWSGFVFPGPGGKRLRFDHKLTRKLRTAAKAAGLVTGYLHMCRRKGCKHREELADGTPRPCPNRLENGKVCAFISWVEPIPKKYMHKDLRSTFGTLMTKESGDLRLVQQILGHGSYSTTEKKYVHALTAGLVGKIDALTTFNVLATTVSKLSATANGNDTNGVIRDGSVELNS